MIELFAFKISTPGRKVSGREKERRVSEVHHNISSLKHQAENI